MPRGGGHGGGRSHADYTELKTNLPTRPHSLKTIGYELQYVALVLILLDLFGVSIAYFGLYDYNLEDLRTAEAANYDVVTSLYDVWIFGLIRVAFIFAGFCHFSTFVIAFWVIFNSQVLLICKAIIFDWTYGLDRSILLGVALALCTFELLVIRIIREKALTPIVDTPEQQKEEESESLSQFQLLRIMKPYFNPDGNLNRFRVCITWVTLITRITPTSTLILPFPILISHPCTNS